MSGDERREVLEDVGLDPDDYDFYRFRLGEYLKSPDIATQKVKQKYDFCIEDDVLFTYKIKKQTYEGILYNTLLKDSIRVFLSFVCIGQCRIEIGRAD